MWMVTVQETASARNSASSKLTGSFSSTRICRVVRSRAPAERQTEVFLVIVWPRQWNSTSAGALLAIWARLYLGGNWSAIVAVKQGHTLVRTGPYRIVRHPIYAGLLAAVGGTPREVLRARDYLLVYGSAAEVRALAPDFAALAKIPDCWAACATRLPAAFRLAFRSRFRS